MEKKLKIKQILNLWRLIPGYLLIQSTDKKDLILDEIRYWGECLHLEYLSTFDLFSCLCLKYIEYRNLAAYRLGGGKALVFKMLFKEVSTLFINTPNIGPRLFIQHGISCIISAKEIGCNCWINQGAQIGYSFQDEPPVIGNGVRISAGAMVLGQFHVGDNAIIGANAVVVHDVPERAIVGGVPAKIIGENTDHILWKPQ